MPTGAEPPTGAPRFSASDAALEGFYVIRDHWRLVAGWAGFSLLALVMLVVALVVLLLVITAVLGGGAPAQAAAASVAGVLGFLGSLLPQAIIVGGLYRLLLRPNEPGFLHLRLGRDEFRLLAIWAIWLAGAAMLAALVAAAARAAGPRGGLLAAIGGVTLAVYLTLRIALVAPTSFAERRIDFASSWRLTRGRVGALLGMAFLSACLIGMVLALAWIVLLVVIGAASGWQGLAAVTRGADAFQNHPGPYLLNAAAEILFLPVLWVLSQAPLAAAYKALAARDGEGAA